MRGATDKKSRRHLRAGGSEQDLEVQFTLK